MQSPVIDSVSVSSASKIPGPVEQRKIDFRASIQSTPTSKVLSSGQKRRLKQKRALRVARDKVCKAEIALIETKEYFEDKLSSQKSEYSGVVDRYKSDRKSLATQVETQKLHIEKLERDRRSLATNSISRYFESLPPK